ncbi:hypothetical protein LXA43DRAFT_1091368 [Ganoderma leucocontextum]|nr:hypothetical protein LXA43DRAFT_1091368 [Ganoderma leucocontextum]
MPSDIRLTVVPPVAIEQSILTDHYCTLSALTLLLFEYALTLDREVAIFWKRKATGASVLFLSNRYISLAAYSTRIALMGHWSCSVRVLPYIWIPFSADRFVSEVCFSTLEIVAQVLAYLQYVPWAAFSALRVYALCGRLYRWPLSILVLALSSLLVVMNYARLNWLTNVEETITGTECLMREVRVPSDLNRISIHRSNLSILTFEVTIVPRVGVIIADAIVLCVTWHTTYRSNSVLRRALVRPAGGKRTFSSTLLRDGTMYFGLLFIMNIIYLTLTMFPTEVDELTQVSYVVEFSEPLTTILISRFLLNLQEVNRNLEVSTSRAQTWTPPPSLDTVVFADRVVGPMGLPLSPIDDDVDSEYDAQRSSEYAYPMTPITRRKKWAT